MNVGLLNFISLFFAGLLAGEELVICLGVRGPMASLDARRHIELRQSLIRRLRILVPALFAVALVSTIALMLVTGMGADFKFRAAGFLSLLAFIAITLAGTVPINQAVLGWNPSALPGDWQVVVRKWERLDNARTVAALTAFALLAFPLAFD